MTIRHRLRINDIIIEITMMLIPKKLSIKPQFVYFEV